MIGRSTSIGRFLRECRGTAMIEFAFVAPVLFMLTIGTIDVGRLVWSASMLHHMAREATRYASVHGAEANNVVDASDIETYVKNRLIGISGSEVTVTTTWTPNNSAGGTVNVQLDYTYSFLIGKLVGLNPLALEGESSMVVL
jgi:Flp pilus assembly protein TadG